MDVVYGIHPLLEALDRGTPPLRRILVAEGRSGAARAILLRAEAAAIPVVVKPRSDLDRLAGAAVHQGVVGLCRIPAPASWEEVLASRNPAWPHDLVVLLDHVQDPRNLGAVIRTVHCFGGNGVVIPERRCAPLTPAVIKASAGAAFHTPVAVVKNLPGTLAELKKRNLWIYGADAAGTPVETLRFDGPVGLVLGGEGKGMGRLVRMRCDILVSIPMQGRLDSLNVAVAAGVLLYHVTRQWKERGVHAGVPVGGDHPQG